MDESVEPGYESPNRSNETENNIDIDGCSYGVYKCVALSLALNVAKLEICSNCKSGKPHHLCQNNYVISVYGEEFEGTMGMIKMCKTCVDNLSDE